MMVGWLVVVLLLLPGDSQPWAGRRRKELPISEEDGRRNRPDNKKASECRFGGQSYELEQTWHPDLGPPFNVMYCVHCECVPIHKKRRIVGRVRCKNIKTECPKPTCPDPVLLDGRCCKVCKGQIDNPDLNITVDLDREEQHTNGRHYAAVLTGPHMAGRAATARFYFRKKTLQYSFLMGSSLGWPTLLTYLDRNNDILEEFGLSLNPLQNNTQKLCGAWERLPRKYRKALRSDAMSVSLTTPLGTITGQVSKYYGLASEMFSGLLESAAGAGAGTVILSVNTATGSVHANFLFTGIVKETETRVPFLIRFSMTKDAETRIVEENVILDTPGKDLSSIELKTVFDSPELEALGQGYLKVTVKSNTNPLGELEAFLVPRISCDIFDCILRPTGPETGASPPSPGVGAGMAHMYFTKTGSLQYSLRLDTKEKVTGISIDNNKNSKRLLSVIDGMEANYAGGWANGSVVMSASQVEDMFKENLYLNVDTQGQARALRGRLVTHLAGPADFSGAAVMLGGEDNQMASGLAWVSIDDTCRLHYSVRIEGNNVDKMDQVLQLEDYPVSNLKSVPLFPGTKRTLQDCQGRKCSGHLDNIHKLTMARLNAGDAALLLTGTAPSSPLAMSGHLAATRAPKTCLPRYSRNDLEYVPGYLSEMAEEHGDEELAQQMRQKCAYENTFYEDGEQWESTHVKCKMCSCQRGLVNCESMVCPPTNCSDPIIPQGKCCATCSSSTNMDSGRGCLLGDNKRFHPVGSRWHPYIPPFGFSRCAICSCEEESLEVLCKKEVCPVLTSCQASEAVRVDPLACCKTCPPTIQVVPDPVHARLAPDRAPGELNDMGQEKTSQDILQQGGCAWKGNYHENGDNWHPTVMPWGEMPCVTCTCKDGSVSCKRRCKQLSCPLQVREKDDCCPRCAKSHSEEESARRKQNSSRSAERRRKRLQRIRMLRKSRNYRQGLPLRD